MKHETKNTNQKQKSEKMKITAEINKKAWAIRKNAAKRFNCKVMEISWADCVKQAKENTISVLDDICKRFTASKTFDELINLHPDYNPTFADNLYPEMEILANAYDRTMRAFGDKRRAYRSSCGFPDDMEY